jgi:hypothetical protein
MGLVISKGLTLRKGYIGTDDPDAEAYIAAVEAADEAASPGIGALETATRVAIHSFVKGCKADGIWPAIKASCILAGARTLQGALVPLVGAAPTNFNFVSGDYNRKNGLTGGTPKYIAANRQGNNDPLNNVHASAFVSTAATSALGQFPVYIGHGGTPQTIIFRNQSNGAIGFRCQTATADSSGNGAQTGLIGVSRSQAESFVFRASSTNTTVTRASAAVASTGYDVLGTSTSACNGTMAFYSIGQSLNLALLDARVTDLINAFAAAIP